MPATAIDKINEALKARRQKQRERAFIASLKQSPKSDAAANPSESVNTPLLNQIRQARNLLCDEVQR